ncbi:MAG: DUF3016 domain-containing protein [Idiomarina sp.]
MKRTLLGLSLYAMAMSAAHAGTAEVTWGDVDEFHDVRAAANERPGYQERLVNELTAHFQELATTLPEGYVWKVAVTDLDLAGRLDFAEVGNRTKQVRTVDDIEYPRINFESELIDASGTVVEQRSVEIKDMRFLDGVARASRSNNERLFFEKKMIRDWFRSGEGPKAAS